MIIIKPNSVINNAKGDITTSTQIILEMINSPVVTSFGRIILNTDGTISYVPEANATVIVAAPLEWVDTDGTNDNPVDLTPWSGGSNYTVSWSIPGNLTIPQGQIGSDINSWFPSFAGSGLLDVERIFEVSGNSDLADTITWDITITNNLTGQNSVIELIIKFRIT
jgi:hypothetical protein